jgi:hypothetical protein
MLGVTPATLARWELGEANPGAAEQARIKRVAAILRKLAGVMRPGFIPTWLTSPNESCKALGAQTPLALLARGDYEDIEDSIFFMGSGVAF